MNFEFQVAQAREYVLRKAVLLYTASAMGSAGTLAVEHDVMLEDGKQRLAEGKFVTESFVSELLRMCKSSDMVFLPEQVVAMSTHSVAWIEPASKRTMFFKTHDEAVMAYDGDTIAQPPLLFVARAHNIYVYGLTSNDRPTPDTPLYYAPFWNVYDDGAVCIGSMQLPKTISPAATADFTTAFFKSEFTHASGNKKRWKPGVTYAQFLSMVKQRKRFDIDWLMPMKATVKDALCGNPRTQF